VNCYTCRMKKSRKNHILFLARWYPNKYDPMFGLFIQRHAIAINNYADVSVIYIHPAENIEKQEVALSETAGVTEIKVYYPRKNNTPQFLNGFKYLHSFVKAYKTYLDLKQKPDIIHVNILTRMGVLALFIKAFMNIPYIITEHWSRYLPQNNSYSGWVRKLVTKLVVRKAAAVTTVTRNLKEAMEKWGLKNKNYQVVPNVVDTDFFHPATNSENKEIKNLIHLSCFEERSKNMSGILRVLQRLSEQRSDFRLNMVGEGEDLEQTIEMAEKLKIKDRFVFFAGLKQGEELLQYMQNADVMIMFSHYENLPVVILEAFACGLPVLSSDVGGISEHLTDEKGRLVPPGDEEIFLSELNRILDNLDRFDRDKIRKYAVNHFSNDAVGKQFDAIYREILTDG